MNDIKSHLKEFKLAGMLNSLEERITYANDNSLSYGQFLELLCEDEASNVEIMDIKRDMLEQNSPLIKQLKILILAINHL